MRHLIWLPVGLLAFCLILIACVAAALANSFWMVEQLAERAEHCLCNWMCRHENETPPAP